MAIISFWSNEEGKMANATSIVAITTFLAIQHNYKILILDTNYNNYSYQDCYWQEDKTVKLIQGANTVDTVTAGIKGLTRAILSNKTSPEIVTNYTRIVFKDRLEVLTDSQLKKDDYQICKRTFSDIAKIANRYYDLVFVDIGAELDDNTKNSLLATSDIIVANITQNMRKINNFIRVRQENTVFSEKPVIPLLIRYDEYSKYNTRNIARYIKEKKGVYAIPYNTLFFEACSEAKVADFFIKFRKMDSKDRNALFMSYVKNIAEKIIYRLQELQIRL